MKKRKNRWGVRGESGISPRLIAIIGDPIEHSLSPAMHNAAYRAMGLSFVYLPFHVRPRELKGFVKKARRWGLAGFNVTIPHKEAILKYLDRLSPEAKRIGAVNTVVRKGKKLVGYNTDAIGYLQSLKEDARFNPQGKKILILGAGGAARAVLDALLSAGACEIYVCNRTPSRARNLASDFRRGFKEACITAVPWDTKGLREIFPAMDLVVNTTPIGQSPLPLASLPKKAVVSDLVYRPLLTPLLQAAKRRGLRPHSGLGMLVHQGAESFYLWTGKRPDLKVMRDALSTA